MKNIKINKDAKSAYWYVSWIDRTGIKEKHEQNAAATCYQQPLGITKNVANIVS